MPAVSPAPVSNTPRPDSKLPIESRSFESLLDEARQSEPLAGSDQTLRAADSTDGVVAAEKSDDAQPTNQSDPLPGLTGIGSIHNASLRQIVAGDTQT